MVSGMVVEFYLSKYAIGIVDKGDIRKAIFNGRGGPYYHLRE